MPLPYPKNETDQSFKYLKEVLDILDEPVCMIGGWAIYFTVNENYRAVAKEDYLFSRDIDLGFHFENDSEIEGSTFMKAVKKLEKDGFEYVGGRMVKQLDWDTGKELSQVEAKKKPQFDVIPMYVDLMVDCIPKKFPENYLVFDEPLLSLVFEDNNNRAEIKEFGHKVWLPKPWLLLSTKIKALPNRQKDHKREKDICDIASLLLFRADMGQSDDTIKVVRVLKKAEVLHALKSITEDEIKTTEATLKVQQNSFKARLTTFINQIENIRVVNNHKQSPSSRKGS